MLPWIDVLEPLYPLIYFDNIDWILSDSKYDKEKILLVLDASLLTEEYHLSLICKNLYKVIVVHENRNSDQKIQYIYEGARGYSDYSLNKKLVIRAVERVLNNEIWLERKLISQLLQGVVGRSDLSNHKAFKSEALKVLLTLTQRETEVVKLVYNGCDNIFISQALNISNRTVKAHLSVAYRKLNVTDRFQLIVFLKNLHLGHLSSVDDLFESSELST